jgi:protein-L-isoaspartate(D-aspartate) O-methyltransferase
MVDELTARDVLPAEWRDAFLAVQRHAFIPETVWRVDKDTDAYNDLCPVHRAADPDAWLELAYADQAVITQVDDGQPVGPGLTGSEITSSASMPTMVAIMLNALELRPGMSVLEIGTGTGYNAALLAARLGAAQVTTVEIDPELAARARTTLMAAGFGDVTVITGDGGQGWSARAPYDRVLSTAACQQIPYAWVAQTRPGGLIVTPWSSDYQRCALLCMVVGNDGTVRGRIIGQASFMALRDQRIPRGSVAEHVHDRHLANRTATDLHPHNVAGDYDAATAIGIRVPHCLSLYQPAAGDGTEAILWFLDPWSRSWAALHHDPEVRSDEYPVRHYGPRNLWAEVEDAYRWWVTAGRPNADRWLFTVGPDGQRIDLDDVVSFARLNGQYSKVRQ